MEVAAVEVELKFDEASQKVLVRFGKTLVTLINPELKPSRYSLELTGIKEEALSDAPTWNKIQSELKEFLTGQVLVGHNVSFDLKFLQAQGLDLKNEVFDTLELAQTFLPFLPSHSLEYLSQEFGAGTLEPAHRALFDAKSCAHVLAQILNEFLNFPTILQEQLKKYLARSNLAFKNLFLELPEIQRSEARKKKSETRIKPLSPLIPPLLGEKDGWRDWPDKTILNLPLDFKEHEEFLGNLALQKVSGLVVVPARSQIEFLPSAQRILSPSWALCVTRHEQFRESFSGQNDSLAKILIKIAILEVLEPKNQLDLALLRWTKPEYELLKIFLADPEVCRKHQCSYFQSLDCQKDKVYFLDLQAFFELLADSWQLDFSERRALLLNLWKIEEEFTESLTMTWNLRKIRRHLAVVYQLDPHFPSLTGVLPQAVEELANELDLFFGILHLVYLKKDREYTQTLLLDEKEEDGERFRNLLAPVQKLIAKLSNFVKFLDDQKLTLPQTFYSELEGLSVKFQKFGAFLENFFTQSADEKHLRYFRFHPDWVDLNYLPKNLQTKWQERKQRVKSLTILDSVLPQSSVRYFQDRLGLSDYHFEKFRELASKPKPVVHLTRTAFTQTRIQDLFNSFSGPTLLVLSNETKLKDYLENFTGSERLDKRQSLRAKDRKSKILFLQTTNALLRFLGKLPELENLVILRLPFEAPGARPALLQIESSTSFNEHTTPRAIHVLHIILSRFFAAAGENKQVYILDERVLHDYDQVFERYLEDFFKIEEFGPSSARLNGQASLG